MEITTNSGEIIIGLLIVFNTCTVTLGCKGYVTTALGEDSKKGD